MHANLNDTVTVRRMPAALGAATCSRAGREGALFVFVSLQPASMHAQGLSLQLQGKGGSLAVSRPGVCFASPAAARRRVQAAKVGSSHSSWGWGLHLGRRHRRYPQCKLGVERSCACVCWRLLQHTPVTDSVSPQERHEGGSPKLGGPYMEVRARAAQRWTAWPASLPCPSALQLWRPCLPPASGPPPPCQGRSQPHEGWGVALATASAAAHRMQARCESTHACRRLLHQHKPTAASASCVPPQERHEGGPAKPPSAQELEEPKPATTFNVQQDLPADESVLVRPGHVAQQAGQVAAPLHCSRMPSSVNGGSALGWPA